MRRAAALLILVYGTAQAVEPPDGYRMGDYRSPTPSALPGAEVATVEIVARLAAAGEAVLVDVLPAPPRPPDLGPQSVWLPPPRLSIPGSVWLPNVGYGALSAEQEAYFRAGLAQLTADRPDRPLLFFCERDCWMSWNAARRALEYGYRAVLWYPDGTQGWAEAGHQLVGVSPLEVGE